MMILVMMLVGQSSVVRADGPVDESSVAAMVKAMVDEQMAKQNEEMAKQNEEMAKQNEEMAKQNEEMAKQKETIAALTAALEAKADQKHIQLTTGGEVVELVSAADVKALERRVEVCEQKNEAQDAKIGMTVATVHKMREERKDVRARPVAMPGRRLSSSSNGNFVNELSITGPNAVVSWNSHTPGLTPFNCTGVGDGRLTCSGTIQALDVVIDGTSTSVADLMGEVAALRQDIAAVMAFAGMTPPISPPAPPAPPAPFTPASVYGPYDCSTFSSGTNLGVTLPLNNPFILRLAISVHSVDMNGGIFEDVVRSSTGTGGRLQIGVDSYQYGGSLFLEAQAAGTSWGSRAANGVILADSTVFTAGTSYLIEITFDDAGSIYATVTGGVTMSWGPTTLGGYLPSGDPSLCYTDSGGIGQWSGGTIDSLEFIIR